MKKSLLLSSLLFLSSFLSTTAWTSVVGAWANPVIQSQLKVLDATGILNQVNILPPKIIFVLSKNEKISSEDPAHIQMRFITDGHLMRYNFLDQWVEDGATHYLAEVLLEDTKPCKIHSILHVVDNSTSTIHDPSVHPLEVSLQYIEMSSQKVLGTQSLGGDLEEIFSVQPLELE